MNEIWDCWFIQLKMASNNSFLQGAPGQPHSTHSLSTVQEGSRLVGCLQGHAHTAQPAVPQALYCEPIPVVELLPGPSSGSVQAFIPSIGSECSCDTPRKPWYL